MKCKMKIAKCKSQIEDRSLDWSFGSNFAICSLHFALCIGAFYAV